MNIEIYFTNDNYIQMLNNLLIDNTVTVKQDIKNSIYILSFFISGEDEDNAKHLSEILEEVKVKCQNEKYYISKNESSAYFNRQLYPHFNSFERSLRNLIYIIAIKSNDTVINNIADKIETLEFGDIADEIIYTKKPVKAYKNKIQNNPNAKFYRKKAIADAEGKTLWSFMVKENSFILEHFEQLKEYRNAVMHARNMNYLDYCKALALIEGANFELDNLSLHYLEQSIYLRPDMQKDLNKIVEKIFLKTKRI